MNHAFGKNLIREIEILIAEHMKVKCEEIEFAWMALPGTGSTSERKLVRVTIGDIVYSFVIKRYMIRDRFDNESLAQSKREYDSLKFLQAHESSLWRTPTPIAYMPEQGAIIMEYFPGENVGAIFWRAVRFGMISRIHTGWIMQLINDIAIIILEIQNLKKTTGVMPVSGEWYSSFLDEQMKALRCFGIHAQKLQRLRIKVVDALDSFLSGENICFQHTDLYFNNILYSDGRYCILDLPNSCIGTRYWDISHLMVSIEHYKLFRNVDDTIIDDCIKSFCKHFVLDPYLIEIMQLIHCCFSLKLSFMFPYKGIKKILTQDPVSFYERKINAFMKDMS